ncbi:MAG: Na+/H+ antiporter NhaA [Campylobacterales bacterium]|nr:Na+/H+ antiporter NhaA [Campylobacterales bacterium]
MNTLAKGFIKKESSSGIVLIFITILALLISNSFLSVYYNAFLNTVINISINNFSINKPLYLWINDGLMTLFFLIVGLEIKREVAAGHLSSISKISLPLFAALGGMIVPALIYFAFNYDDPEALRGWAIPTATDIAFALGILALLGKRIPLSLKIFLMALAIIDDIGAILIIALFYTSSLSIISVYVGLVCVAILFIMNRCKVGLISLYMVVGVILWVAVLKSGVHATLAGILLAFMIPLEARDKRGRHVSPAKTLRKNLHLWVAFFILPLFAFVNAGIDFRNLDFSLMLEDVPLGIFFALFLGKQFGVFLFTYVSVKLNWTKLPKCTSWAQIYGVSVLAGIGFTMSLFIDSLAFVDHNMYLSTDRLSILCASVFSGTLGYLILRFTKPPKNCNI